MRTPPVVMAGETASDFCFYRRYPMSEVTNENYEVAFFDAINRLMRFPLRSTTLKPCQLKVS